MRELTRELVLTLATAACSPQQIAEAERMIEQWLEEHLDDAGYLHTVRIALAMRRQAAEGAV